MQQKTAPNAEDQDTQDVADTGPLPEPENERQGVETSPPLELEP